MYLYISPTGVRSWRYDYRFGGQRKTLTFGKYPLITLAEARKEKEAAQKLLAHGKDPSTERKKTNMLTERERENTFRKITTEWFQTKRGSWSKQTLSMIMRYFEMDIFEYIGDKSISAIKPLEMLDVLKKIENRGALEIARKMRQRCSEVFQYAIITGRCENNPARELAKAMINQTPKNYPFLTEQEMKEFLIALGAYAGNLIIRYATELLILTALRTVELRTMKWSDVDFENRLITIREEVMKKRRLHIVPLSMQAYKILEFLKPITGHCVMKSSTNEND